MATKEQHEALEARVKRIEDGIQESNRRWGIVRQWLEEQKKSVKD